MNIMIKIVKRMGGGAAASIVVATAAFFATVGAALAQNASQGSTQVSLTDPLGGGETFLSVVNNVAGFLFTDIAIPLATIMILVGAFQFMTGGGDAEKISKARKTIMYAAIGFGIALIASGASSIIKSILLNQ
jgi:hypothetical protein